MNRSLISVTAMVALTLILGGCERKKESTTTNTSSNTKSTDQHEGHDHGLATGGGGSGQMNHYLQIYAGVTSLLVLVLGQLLWNAKRKPAEPEAKQEAKPESKTESNPS